MGVAVAQDPVVVDGVELPALVAGDDARRNAERPHQDDEGRSDVLAKTLLAVEPELVCRVVAEDARVERVGVAAGAQTFEHRTHERGRVGAGQCGVAAHLRGQRDRARVRAVRQSLVSLQRSSALQRTAGELRVAFGAVSHEVVQRAVGEPLQVGRARHLDTGWHPWCARRGIQRQQPGPIAGFERDLVAHGRALHTQVGLQRAARPRRQGGPFAAIELRQHRSPKVHVALRGHGTVELDARRDGVVERQLRDGADPHGVR